MDVDAGSLVDRDGREVDARVDVLEGGAQAFSVAIKDNLKRRQSEDAD